VIRAQDYSPTTLTPQLVLAVEVLSASTRPKEAMLKRSKYQDAGVPSYWMVDPERPWTEALTLVDGEYRRTGRAAAGDPLELPEPFPVTLLPAALVADPAVGSVGHERG
jgi:hypothetical protein